MFCVFTLTGSHLGPGKLPTFLSGHIKLVMNWPLPFSAAASPVLTSLFYFVFLLLISPQTCHAVHIPLLLHDKLFPSVCLRPLLFFLHNPAQAALPARFSQYWALTCICAPCWSLLHFACRSPSALGWLPCQSA